MAEWQDIATAPKDGTHILAYVPWLIHPKTLFWARYAGTWRCPASEDGPAGVWEPTHWQPIPAPPVVHASDCAVHNAPALPVGPCDCGAVSA